MARCSPEDWISITHISTQRLCLDQKKLPCDLHCILYSVQLQFITHAQGTTSVGTPVFSRRDEVIGRHHRRPKGDELGAVLSHLGNEGRGAMLIKSGRIGAIIIGGTLHTQVPTPGDLSPIKACKESPDANEMPRQKTSPHTSTPGPSWLIQINHPNDGSWRSAVRSHAARSRHATVRQRRVRQHQQHQRQKAERLDADDINNRLPLLPSPENLCQIRAVDPFDSLARPTTRFESFLVHHCRSGRVMPFHPTWKTSP